MEENFEALKKYNFWDNNYPELGFPRDLYTNKIYESTGNRLIKVLVGQRRVGKSYILRQIIYRLIEGGVNNRNIIYINKELDRKSTRLNSSHVRISYAVFCL